MPDMPSDFWSGWIIVLTVTSVGGLLWFVFSLYFGSGGPTHEESPVWDETLTEGEHPAPMWWFWTMLAALVFSVIYLMLYPGLGSFSGYFKWSQSHDIEHGQARFETAFRDERQAVLDAPIAALQSDELAMASARRVFIEHCAACHGRDAAGQAKMFPNLVDESWQWGGDAASIERTLVAGRVAVMPPWQAVIGDDGVDEVVAHVRSLNGQAAPSAEGAQLYATYCVACHGVDGSGVPMLGGPNLLDPASLYGDDMAALRVSIAEGRQGEMPAFGDRLDAVQIRLLVAWLMRDQPPTEALAASPSR